MISDITICQLVAVGLGLIVAGLVLIIALKMTDQGMYDDEH